MSFRADKPFPPRELGVDYFEVKVLKGERGEREAVTAIGLCSEFANLAINFGGHRRFSIGYHSDDGEMYESITDEYGGINKTVPCETYGEEDTVGCGVDWDLKEVFFTLNGTLQGEFLSY